MNYRIVELDNGDYKYWPCCPIEGCPNMIQLGEATCFPHTGKPKPTCECGAHKVGSKAHANWCQLADGE